MAEQTPNTPSLDPQGFTSIIDQFNQFVSGLAGEVSSTPEQPSAATPPPVATPQQEASETPPQAAPQAAPAEQAAQKVEAGDLESMVRDLLQEEGKEAPQTAEVNLMDYLRDPSKLDELAERDPRQAYQVAKLINNINRFFQSMAAKMAPQPAATAPPEPPKPSPPAQAPQSEPQPTDPYLAQLFSLRDQLTKALERAQSELQALQSAPEPKAEERTEETSIFGEASPRVEDRQWQALQRDLQEAKLLSRIQLIDQIAQRVNQEIMSRQLLSQLQRADLQQALTRVSTEYQTTRDEIATRLNEVLERVNQQLGIGDQGEIIAHATRHQLMLAGLDPDREILRIVSLPAEERRVEIDNFIRRMARAYIQNARRLATPAKTEEEPRRVPIEAPAAPPAQTESQPTQRTSDVFSSAEEEFSKAMRSIEKYLQGFPTALSGLKI